MSKICPTCIDELVPDKRKLGKVSNWLKCPSCGFRVRPYDPQPDTHFIKESKRPDILEEDEENRSYY